MLLKSKADSGYFNRKLRKLPSQDDELTKLTLDLSDSQFNTNQTAMSNRPLRRTVLYTDDDACKL